MSMAAAAVDTFALTPGRIVGTLGAFAALAGVVVGWRALVRRTRKQAIVALVAGPTGMVVGGLVVALAKGGPGTGYGIVGGYAALAIGLAATVLGWLALTRSPGYRKEVSTK
ncbi:DUF6223 family protein [Actinocrispum sp. NPDC049592]|uniref:DUF6223 family protein n=1 Tax=Actinocrispum sp. NPDC049592 TaxID=3154835 RepID=UPI00344031AA